MEHNQLNQSNDNNRLIAEILHRGVTSGDLKLSDDDVRTTVLSFTRHIISLNKAMFHFNKSNPPTNRYPCESLLLKHQQYIDDSSSLTNSVHIPDGIDDNSDKAQELSSHHRVSGIGEAVNDGAFISTSSSRKRPVYMIDKDNESMQCKTKRSESWAPENGLSCFHEISMYITNKYKELESSFCCKYENCCKYYHYLYYHMSQTQSILRYLI